MLVLDLLPRLRGWNILVPGMCSTGGVGHGITDIRIAEEVSRDEKYACRGKKSCCDVEEKKVGTNGERLWAMRVVGSKGRRERKEGMYSSKMA